MVHCLHVPRAASHPGHWEALFWLHADSFTKRCSQLCHVSCIFIMLNSLYFLKRLLFYLRVEHVQNTLSQTWIRVCVWFIAVFSIRDIHHKTCNILQRTKFLSRDIIDKSVPVYVKKTPLKTHPYLLLWGDYSPMMLAMSFWTVMDFNYIYLPEVCSIQDNLTLLIMLCNEAVFCFCQIN